MTLDEVFTSDRLLNDNTGLNQSQFDYLLHEFKIEFENYRLEESMLKKGRHPDSRGRPTKYSVKQLMAMLLMYLKSYDTYSVMEVKFGMNRKNLFEWLTKLQIILARVLQRLGHLPLSEEADPEELKKVLKKSKKLFIDATEHEIQRPKDAEVRRSVYSGKKKVLFEAYRSRE